jgi:hypothetical protein
VVLSSLTVICWLWLRSLLGSSSKAVDPEASHQKGLAKLYGTGGERQHVGAGLAMLEDAANAGSVEAAYDLAQCSTTATATTGIGPKPSSGTEWP